MPQNTPTLKSELNEFSKDDVRFFNENGYIIVRGLVNSDMVSKIREVTQNHLENIVEPVEYETDVQYPGAPTSRQDAGGNTIRRLRNALSRHPVFSQWVSQKDLSTRLRQLLSPNIVCPLAHHNCVMTKLPEFSSQTGWHQDARYWSFQKPDLVSVWLALGSEHQNNGCLQLIPGSHKMQFTPEQFDKDKFFRADLEQNEPILEKKIYAELEAGDVLFFHCLTLHAADRNESDQRKFSAVFTFRSGENLPIAESRSASMPELLLP